MIVTAWTINVKSYRARSVIGGCACGFEAGVATAIYLPWPTLPTRVVPVTKIGLLPQSGGVRRGSGAWLGFWLDTSALTVG